MLFFYQIFKTKFCLYFDDFEAATFPLFSVDAASLLTSFTANDVFDCDTDEDFDVDRDVLEPPNADLKNRDILDPLADFSSSR